MTDESRPSDDVVDDRPRAEADPTSMAPGRPPADMPADKPPAATSDTPAVAAAGSKKQPPQHRMLRLVRELAVILAIALVASALLRAFVVQAYYVPSGSMLPTIEQQDRIMVSRIGDVDRGEVVVFSDPGGWIPSAEQADPPGSLRRGLEWIGVLPASGHEHLVKRVVGLPGDHVVCCDRGSLVINEQRVDESDFLFQGDRPADNVAFDVVVPADHVFVLGDHRYVSGDSSRQQGQNMFVPIDLVVGRAFAVIWPPGNMRLLDIPDAYDDVPEGSTRPSSA